VRRTNHEAHKGVVENGASHLSRNELTIVVVSRRSRRDLGPEAPVAAALTTPEWAGKGAGSPDVYLVDVSEEAHLSLVAQLAQGGRQPLVVFGGTGGSETVSYLDAGAADYIPRGVGPAELAARLRAAVRRSSARVRAEANAIVIGDVSISVARHEVSRAGEVVRLTPHEFTLLETLLNARGEVVPHRQLMVAVWGVANSVNRHALRIYIRQLRMKLEADPQSPAIIVTERSRGYRLNADAAQPTMG
jgi:two-component system KDP operon response regulator KdpE